MVNVAAARRVSMLVNPKPYLIRARRATDTQVNAPRIQGSQRAELLRHHERGMVRQHDSAGANADRGGTRRDVTYHHGRCRAGNAGTVVMFGQPVPAITPALRVAGKIEAVAQ
jgi:hypothetical protein